MFVAEEAPRFLWMLAIDIDCARPTLPEELLPSGHLARPSGAVYPAHLEADVELRDESSVHLRPVRAADQPGMSVLFKGLSLQARAFRFFSGGADLEGTARLMVDVDYVGRYGAVATRGVSGNLLAHATYMRTSSNRAEVAFAVADELRGLGLATLMLAHLAEVARGNGIARFFAEVLPENHRMIEVFEDSGFPVQTRVRADTIRLEFPTAFSPKVAECFARRDRSIAK